MTGKGSQSGGVLLRRSGTVRPLPWSTFAPPFAGPQREGVTLVLIHHAARVRGNTRTDAGLRVRAELDKRQYPTGVTATDAEMDALSLHRNEFHGDWNYELHPR